MSALARFERTVPLLLRSFGNGLPESLRVSISTVAEQVLLPAGEPRWSPCTVRIHPHAAYPR